MLDLRVPFRIGYKEPIATFNRSDLLKLNILYESDRKDKSMLCSCQANPICDGKSFHRMTGASYAWLSLTNMKDNNTLTQREA
jgi:hypothetical protein